MAETSHVPMAGEHAPTAEAAMQLVMAVSRSARVVYTRRGGGDGGDGGGGGKAMHTEPPLPTNAVVSRAVFENQMSEQSTRSSEVA